jgi:ELP3 family radical SAM enzyme/protein acetyltransferase
MGDSADIEDIQKPKKLVIKRIDCDDFLVELMARIGKVSKYTAEDVDKVYSVLRSETKCAPSKAELRESFEKLNKVSPIQLTSVFKRWLIKKAMRSDSGVLVVTLVTKPGDKTKFSCPYKCSYCPSETDHDGNPTQPKSYISSEPAMRRALNSNFDIGGQIRDRINAYLSTGNIKNDQNKKKIEVILSGGTWDVMPFEYRQQVINELFYNFNTFNDPIETRRKMLSTDEEIMINQTATYGVIGLSVETRPDHINRRSIKQYLKWGITRVQIGVQHFDDDILRKIKRDCYLRDTINAIRSLKKVGLKIVIHLMPDLPGSSPNLDRWMFDQLISSPDLQVDDLKIYPCAVIKSHDPKYVVTSDISEWYDKGEYVPYSETNLQDLIDVLIDFKKRVHRWIRIERLIRDIPSQSMTAGYGKISNLRQVIEKQMNEHGERCHCIRCMEIRNREYEFYRLSVRPYKASDGMEYHINVDIEDQKYHYDWIKYLFWYWIFFIISFGYWKIFYEGSDPHYIGTLGFCRLRIDLEPRLDIAPELEGCGLIRELHVYGQAVCVGEESISTQHKGFGSLLMKTAETIIKENGLAKSAVIAGVGAREYYKTKHMYELEGTYMIKTLK